MRSTSTSMTRPNATPELAARAGRVLLHKLAYLLARAGYSRWKMGAFGD
nr:hypothetical protein [Methanosarcina sp. 2.H.A.1B.4]